MQQQTSLLHVLRQNKSRNARREEFLSPMEKSSLWAFMVVLVTPFCAIGNSAHPPIGLDRISRHGFVKRWCHFSNEAIDVALDHTPVLIWFYGIHLISTVPDSFTVDELPLFARGQSGGSNDLFKAEALPAGKGLILMEGPFIDEILIAASPSPQFKKRDPEMHPFNKGIEWHCGRKMLIGLDDSSVLNHAERGEGGSDIHMEIDLLHGSEQMRFFDAGSIGNGHE